jgi:hypothetical protein
MFKKRLACLSLIVLVTAAHAQDQARTEDPVPAPQEQQPQTPAQPPSAAQAADNASPQVKTLSGMSILGNEEAPKSLVIVPWKSSELGDGVGVEDLIDARARPVDKDVFLREVRYYQLRSGGND